MFRYSKAKGLLESLGEFTDSENGIQTIILNSDVTPRMLSAILLAAYNQPDYLRFLDHTPSFDHSEWTDILNEWGKPSLHDNEEYADIRIELRQSSSTPSTPSPRHVHRFLLALRIPYFNALLLSDFADAKQDNLILDPYIVSPIQMDRILAYVYGGPPAVVLTTLDSAKNLYAAADFLGITELCTHCIQTFYDLTHDLSCGCAPCSLMAPKIASFARDKNLVGLEEDCRFVMVRQWVTCWPAVGFGELGPELREEVLLGVLEMVTVGSVVDMMWGRDAVRKTLDGVKASWGDVVREMVARVDERIKELIVHRFASVCRADEELQRALGFGFGPVDSLEEVLGIAVAGLTEGNAVEILSAMVRILWPYSEELMENEVEGKRGDFGPAAAALRKARRRCVNFIAKRWMSIHHNGGFKGIDHDILREIAAGTFMFRIKP